jgi:C-terminal processing protease CtpA/Prc
MGIISYSDAIILDLRQNHGGFSNMVNLISSYFFEDSVELNSLYFSEKDSLIQDWTNPAVPGKKLIDQKLYILTSKNTASAAESFSYMMKQYGRATIIGETTRGAAHWTETYQYPDLGIFLEIPVARPVNPVTKTDWQGTGVNPDIEIPEKQAFTVAYEIAHKMK